MSLFPHSHIYAQLLSPSYTHASKHMQYQSSVIHAKKLRFVTPSHLSCISSSQELPDEDSQSASANSLGCWEESVLLYIELYSLQSRAGSVSSRLPIPPAFKIMTTRGSYAYK